MEQRSELEFQRGRKAQGRPDATWSFPYGSFINNWPEHSQCDTFPGLETILATVELKEEQKY